MGFAWIFGEEFEETDRGEMGRRSGCGRSEDFGVRGFFWGDEMRWVEDEGDGEDQEFR